MDQSVLSSRALIGEYFLRLEQNPGLAWVNATANLFGSDQGSEKYAWLGMSPLFREWVGGRQAKGLRGTPWEISNVHYEATLEVQKKDIRRDKTGQIVTRIQEFADQSQTHWASLLTRLRLNGATTVCYDGQYYYDTDHVEGDSGTQSNKLSVDISALACAVHGTTTDPSVEEMQQAILQGVTAIVGFKSDNGEPLNEGAREFLVMTPIGLYLKALAAVNPASLSGLSNNVLASMNGEFKINVVPNPRLTWTDKFTVDRTDSPIKPFIRQSEQEVELKVKAEGSEYEFDNDAWQFGIDAWRGAGYGFWQRSVLVDLD